MGDVGSRGEGRFGWSPDASPGGTSPYRQARNWNKRRRRLASPGSATGCGGGATRRTPRDRREGRNGNGPHWVEVLSDECHHDQSRRRRHGRGRMVAREYPTRDYREHSSPRSLPPVWTNQSPVRISRIYGPASRGGRSRPKLRVVRRERGGVKAGNGWARGRRPPRKDRVLESRPPQVERGYCDKSGNPSQAEEWWHPESTIHSRYAVGKSCRLAGARHAEHLRESTRQDPDLCWWSCLGGARIRRCPALVPRQSYPPVGRTWGTISFQESITGHKSHVDRGPVRGTTARHQSRDRPAEDSKASRSYGLRECRERVSEPPLVNRGAILGRGPGSKDQTLGHNAVGGVPRSGPATPCRIARTQQSQATATQHGIHQHGGPTTRVVDGIPPGLSWGSGKGPVGLRHSLPTQPTDQNRRLHNRYGGCSVWIRGGTSCVLDLPPGPRNVFSTGGRSGRAAPHDHLRASCAAYQPGGVGQAAFPETPGCVSRAWLKQHGNGLACHGTFSDPVAAPGQVCWCWFSPCGLALVGLLSRQWVPSTFSRFRAGDSGLVFRPPLVLQRLSPLTPVSRWTLVAGEEGGDQPVAKPDCLPRVALRLHTQHRRCKHSQVPWLGGVYRGTPPTATPLGLRTFGPKRLRHAASERPADERRQTRRTTTEANDRRRRTNRRTATGTTRAATTERLRRTAGEKGGHLDTPFPYATPRRLFPSEFPHDGGRRRNSSAAGGTEARGKGRSLCGISFPSARRDRASASTFKLPRKWSPRMVSRSSWAQSRAISAARRFTPKRKQRDPKALACAAGNILLEGTAPPLPPAAWLSE